MLKVYTLFCVTLYLMTGESFCIDATCGPIDSLSVQDKMWMVIVKGNNTHRASRKLIQNTDNALDDLVPTIPSILYVHGYMESSESPTVQSVVSAYLHRGDVNILVLNWGQIASDLNYYFVAKQIPAVGKTAADLLTNISNIIDLQNLHIIGHSLGAHVAGYIARNLNTNVPRITGLDPAFPLFYPSSCHIQPTDAQVVSILHTDGGVLGTPTNTGTIDFYANHGVRPQPGCPLFGGRYCSHQMSVRLFAESVVNPQAFRAKPCSNGFNNNPDVYETALYNDNTPSGMRGTYCFMTGTSNLYGNI